MPWTETQLSDSMARKPVMLAPMEDVSDVVFRRIARGFGADVCFTEFVNVEGLLRGCRNAKRKMLLARRTTADTAIQIYGSNPERLAEAARVAEAAQPAFIDINCGCWVPKIAGRGAGAGWLRDPEAMVAMAKMVVSSVSCLVTVKTRIGLGPSRRCRSSTSRAASKTPASRRSPSTAAPRRWATRAAPTGAGPRRAREVVSIPVDRQRRRERRRRRGPRARETKCEGVMVGRRAIEHPWVFREIRARLDGRAGRRAAHARRAPRALPQAPRGERRPARRALRRPRHAPPPQRLSAGNAGRWRAPPKPPLLRLARGLPRHPRRLRRGPSPREGLREPASHHGSQRDARP